MEKPEPISIGGTQYRISKVKLEDFDLVWDSGIRLLTVAIRSGADVDLDSLAESGSFSLAELDMKALSEAIDAARDVLGWKFIYKELGPVMARHCTVVAYGPDGQEIPRRLDACWSQHWNERGAKAVILWTLEALKVNCADFLDGFAGMLAGPAQAQVKEIA